MQTKIILLILTLASAIPLGLLAKKLTKHETTIYKKQQYFPTFLWVLAIASAIFYTLNIQIALTLTFMFIFIFIWQRYMF